MWESESVNDHFAPDLNAAHECDLDVGVLECGTDEQCIPSSTSRRGGICHTVFAIDEGFHRLQENETLTLCNRVAAQPGYTCDCTQFDAVNYEGQFTCTDEGWCDEVDPSLCGQLVGTFYFDAGEPVKFSNCISVGLENLCVASHISGNRMDECLNATMNGCDCNCEALPGYCDNRVDNMTGFALTCPNNVMVDSCDGLRALFGNKVPSCGSNASAPPSLSPPESSTSQSTFSWLSACLLVASTIVMYLRPSFIS